MTRIGKNLRCKRQQLGGVDINCFQISASLKHLEISTLAKPRGQGTLKLGKGGEGGGTMHIV